MKSASTGKKAQSAGFGESRVNRAADGSFPDKFDIRECHMGGELIGNFYDQLPPEAQAALVYRNTDEGIQERQEKLEAEGRLDKGPRVEITRSEWDGEVGEYGERLDTRGGNVRDPFREVIENNTRPGFSGKMLDPGAIKRVGLRGYKPVLDPKTKEPIERGGLILGEIPTEIRDARKAAARRADREQQQLPNKEFREQEEQNFSRAGIPLAAARKASAEGAGLQNDSPYTD